MDIMWILVAVAVGFAIGWKMSAMVSDMAFREILDDLGVSTETLVKQIKKYEPEFKSPSEDDLETIQVKIEEHQGNLYAYRLDDDRFLGQGTDRDELIKRLSENMSNVRLVIANENGAGLISKT